MKTLKIALVALFGLLGFQSFGQQTHYNVTVGSGNGLRFWNSDTYKIHMGNTTEHHYGDVTDFSIKSNMSPTLGRGWTWGSRNVTPVAALSNSGSLQLKEGLGLGFQRRAGLSRKGLYISNPLGYNGIAATANFTSLHLVEKNWSGSHAILFNSYAPSTQGVGSIAAMGNTKYSNDAGTYSNGAGAIMFFANAGLMAFYVSDESTGKDTDVDWGLAKMYIERNGNVGIGTANPTNKLEVKGTIRSRELVCEGPETWPDYVFEEGYELMSLDTVASYIKEFGHLPNIPSAEEIGKDGVAVSAMNAKLLEKIEELTLHLIAIKKENDTLKADQEKYDTILERLEKLEKQ